MAAPALVDERYQILGEIGAGTFATVYRARETETGIVVALKVLRQELRHDPAVVERFRREALAVKNITSDHVVKLFDFGVTGEHLYIAMELVEGQLLRELVGVPFSANDAHVIVGQVAEALAAAHGRNIVHRDLKPENIMLVRDKHDKARVKVLDFGFAKLEELERRRELEPLTEGGMAFGTPQYMSPEQIRGEPVDRACDLYAVGVLAYEMVTGKLPWTGGDPRQVFLAVLESPPPPVASKHPGIARAKELDAFFARALAKRSHERPTDPAGLFRELELALFAVPPRASSLTPFATIKGKSVDLEPLPSEQPFEQEGEIVGTTPRTDALPTTREPLPTTIEPAPPELPPPSYTSSMETAPRPAVTRAPNPPPPRSSHRGIIVLFIVALIVMALAGYWLGTMQ